MPGDSSGTNTSTADVQGTTDVQGQSPTASRTTPGVIDPNEGEVIERAGRPPGFLAAIGRHPGFRGD